MHWRGSPFFSGNVAAAVHIPAKTCSPTSGAPYAMDDLQGICPDCATTPRPLTRIVNELSRLLAKSLSFNSGVCDTSFVR